MKKIIQYLMMLALGLMATSCYYDELPADKVGTLPEVVSYSKDIQPLWSEDCISCHKTGAPIAPDLTVGNSYVALTANNKYVVPGNAANSILYKALLGQGAPLMPPSGETTATEIALVEKWINDGALNN
jgi:hypothetical protein